MPCQFRLPRQALWEPKLPVTKPPDSVEFLKQDTLFNPFICQMRIVRARGDKWLAKDPAKSLGHLLYHRPTGSCYFFLHWFLISKTLLKSFHMQTVLNSELRLWSKLVKFFLSGGPCSKVPPLFFFFKQVKFNFQTEKEGMEEQRIPWASIVRQDFPTP